MNYQISDIKIVGNKIIQVKEVDFNLESIENGIRGMKYLGNGLVKDQRVENAQLPSIAKVFYENLFEGRIITPKKLFETYVNTYFKRTGSNTYKLSSNNEEYKADGIKARVYRAYPSLLRDFHFYVLCFNSKLFDHIEYSFITDTKEGIDLMITYKGVKFGISLFVNTRRSNEFKKKKYRRHDYSNFKEVCISIDPFDKANYVGDYALYQQSHIDFMISEMEKLMAA